MSRLTSFYVIYRTCTTSPLRIHVQSSSETTPYIKAYILTQFSMFCMQKTKALKTLYMCAGLTKPSLFAYPYIGFLKALLISKHKN